MEKTRTHIRAQSDQWGSAHVYMNGGGSHPLFNTTKNLIKKKMEGPVDLMILSFTSAPDPSKCVYV